MTIKINFPKAEHTALKKRLNAGQDIYTTRIDSETEKYKVGMYVEAPWGHILRISTITIVSSLEMHPFYKELTQEQKQKLGVGPMVIFRLCRFVSSYRPEQSDRVFPAADAYGKRKAVCRRCHCVLADFEPGDHRPDYVHPRLDKEGKPHWCPNAGKEFSNENDPELEPFLRKGRRRALKRMGIKP